MCVVAASLFAMAPAHAQQDTERQRNALSQFSDELASCFAYCQVISRCLGRPPGAHTPADLSVAQQYAARARRLNQLAFVFSRSAGRADDATSVFVDQVMRNVMLRMRGSCANVVTVVNEHGDECRELAEHPNDHLEMLLNRNP
jgi:hypothetical protein